nr:immunoglobulin heavy chain junction region [Mus musculus]
CARSGDYDDGYAMDYW